MIPHQNDAAMRKHVKQWQNSSLTQIAYCHNHNIKPHVFSYYKKKFRLASTPVDLLEPTGRFVPVQWLTAHVSEEETQSAVAHPLTLRHNNGFSLEFHPGTELAYLKPLLELVSAII
jgi:hypothetical protein